MASAERDLKRRRFSWSLIGSLLLHGAAALCLIYYVRLPPGAPSRGVERPIEVTLAEPPSARAITSETRAPVPDRAPRVPQRRQSPARPERATSPRPETHHTPEAAPSSESLRAVAAAQAAPSLLDMRGGRSALGLSDDALGALVGPSSDKPDTSRSQAAKRRTPGTGLTTIAPDLDDNVRLRKVDPHYYQVLSAVDRVFKPEEERIADEVRGDLNASTSVKRWLFGAFGGDVDAIKNQVPRLACIVCVTIRFGEPAKAEVTATSTNRFFDHEALAAAELGARSVHTDARVEAARACYHFSGKVWRERPDVRNLMSFVPMLHFEKKVRLIGYQRLGG